jgi:hypothetical protein
LLVTSILLAVAAFIFTVLVCVASSVSFADVCILSPPQVKINTFTDKDVEVSQNSRFANENAGKKIVVFWLGG